MKKNDNALILITTIFKYSHNLQYQPTFSRTSILLVHTI